jgi:aspartyl protease family protein
MVERILLVPVLLSALGCGTVLFDPAGDSAPARMIERAPVSPGEPLQVRQSPDGLFRVPVDLDGATARLVVDTGATRSVIGPATLARLDAGSTGNRGGTLLTFSGEVPYRVVTVARVAIAGRALGPVELAVIDRVGTPDVIGQDLLGRIGTLSIEGDRLTIE